jgi:hypothetical protein
LSCSDIHYCGFEYVCDHGAWVWKKGYCPSCAAPDTPIATPGDDRAIAELRVGDLVYSVDHDAVVVVPIARVSSRPAIHHRVMRVVLDTGAVLEISAGHPTADGRSFGDLVAGDAIDDAHTLTAATLVPYAYSRTYDILPASGTGTYFAASARIGSTLAPAFRATR